jgi:hypothetical protein
MSEGPLYRLHLWAEKAKIGPQETYAEIGIALFTKQWTFGHTPC